MLDYLLLFAFQTNFNFIINQKSPDLFLWILILLTIPYWRAQNFTIDFNTSGDFKKCLLYSYVHIWNMYYYKILLLLLYKLLYPIIKIIV